MRIDIVLMRVHELLSSIFFLMVCTEHGQCMLQAISVLAQTIFKVLQLLLLFTSRRFLIIHHSIENFTLVSTEDYVL